VTADALKVTHPAAIVWAAQMDTVTLHPWRLFEFDRAISTKSELRPALCGCKHPLSGGCAVAGARRAAPRAADND
jgi:hypothetical protein